MSDPVVNATRGLLTHLSSRLSTTLSETSIEYRFTTGINVSLDPPSTSVVTLFKMKVTWLLCALLGFSSAAGKSVGIVYKPLNLPHHHPFYNRSRSPAIYNWR